MIKTTKTELKRLVKTGEAVDITHGDNTTRNEIEATEEYLSQIAYCSGVYGCNGMLLKGHKTGKLYAITDRTTAIYIFG